MDRNYDVITFILIKPTVAIFAGIIKVVTICTKTILKDPKKSKELENMYQNAIYID